MGTNDTGTNDMVSNDMGTNGMGTAIGSQAIGSQANGGACMFAVAYAHVQHVQSTYAVILVLA